jgi:hypothetical protein
MAGQAMTNGGGTEEDLRRARELRSARSHRDIGRDGSSRPSRVRTHPLLIAEGHACRKLDSRGQEELLRRGSSRTSTALSCRSGLLARAQARADDSGVRGEGNRMEPRLQLARPRKASAPEYPGKLARPQHLTVQRSTSREFNALVLPARLQARDHRSSVQAQQPSALSALRTKNAPRPRVALTGSGGASARPPSEGSWRHYHDNDRAEFREGRWRSTAAPMRARSTGPIVGDLAAQSAGTAEARRDGLSARRATGSTRSAARDCLGPPWKVPSPPSPAFARC